MRQLSIFFLITLVAGACSSDGGTSVSTGGSDQPTTVAGAGPATGAPAQLLPVTDELLLVALLTEDATPAGMTFDGPESANLEDCAAGLSPANVDVRYVGFASEDFASEFSGLLVRADEFIEVEEAVDRFETDCLLAELGAEVRTERSADGEILVSHVLPDGNDGSDEIGIAYRLTDGVLVAMAFFGPDPAKAESQAKSLLLLAVERLRAIRAQGYDPADVPVVDEPFAAGVAPDIPPPEGAATPETTVARDEADN